MNRTERSNHWLRLPVTAAAWALLLASALWTPLGAAWGAAPAPAAGR